eukprot:scaffold650_cov407-Prasinococcus_capsulatus_cf.AAC.51
MLRPCPLDLLPRGQSPAGRRAAAATPAPAGVAGPTGAQLATPSLPRGSGSNAAVRDDPMSGDRGAHRSAAIAPRAPRRAAAA